MLDGDWCRADCHRHIHVQSTTTVTRYALCINHFTLQGVKGAVQQGSCYHSPWRCTCRSKLGIEPFIFYAALLYYDKISTKRAKHVNICCCSFNKISIMRKNLCCKIFWPNDKFWQFWPNNFGVAHFISVKFGLWTFRKLWKRQKNFDFHDFWFP